MKAEKTESAEARRFSKQQLLCARRFADLRDVLNAVLADDREYSVAQAEAEIQKYLKGKVK